MGRRTRFRVKAGISLAVATVMLSAMVGMVGWTLHPASLKPQLIEVVRRATGRTLTISGDMGIKLSLVPTVTMYDVSLSNPPGFSRPAVVTVGQVELGLALLPLLRHRFEIEHLRLVRPDVLLETDQAGRANWVFSPPPRQASAGAGFTAAAWADTVVPTVAPGSAATGASSVDEQSVTPGKQPISVSFKDAVVLNGRFGLIDGRSGHRYEAEAPRLTLDAPPHAPIQLDGTVTYDGHAIGVTARSEPATADGTGAWPIALKLESGGATVTADGRIDDPLHGRGYTVAMDARLPDPSVLAPFFPRLPLASLKNVTARAEVTDSHGPLPVISALRANVGSVDLPRFAHGADLEEVTLTARGDAPIAVTGRVTIGGVASAISGTAGDLAWLAGGASGPVAVDLDWHAASAEARVRGTIQTPMRLSGLDLAVSANVPDPSQVVRGAPPALKSVMFRTRLTDAPRLTPFEATSSVGDLSGQVAWSHGARFSVVGQIWSRHLDLDALLGRTTTVAALGGPTANATVAPGESAAGPAEREGGTGSATASAATPPSAVGLSSRGSAPAQTPPEPAAADKPVPDRATPVASDQHAPVIPDMKLPFDLIRVADGDVRFSFLDVRADGADIRKVTGEVSAKDGHLRLDPFDIAAVDQRMSGSLVADATATPPQVHLTVDAPRLGLWPLLAALGLPQAATGQIAVRADLTGSGDTTRALAGSLDGWAGAAVEDGQLDAKMVNAWLDQLRPLRIDGTGVTDLRCFALRGDARDGVVTIQPIALDTPALIVEGSGEVDLRNETLALRFRPRARVGGTGIALPVRVSGPMRSPSARIDISSKGAGALAGLLLGGKDIMGAAGGGDPCPAALARARAGASPSAAAEDASPTGRP